MTAPPLRSLFRQSPGIWYGTRLFSEPQLFPGLPNPGVQGLYAILVFDIAMTPRPFRVLYIGETSSLSSRLTTNHGNYGDWILEAHGRQLYFAYHLTIGMTDEERKDAECVLINQYLPPCNKRVDLPWRLGSLLASK